jgi:hypothetical protein
MKVLVYNDNNNDNNDNNKEFLRKKDEEFMHIQELIDMKRHMLLEKQQKIKFISKQNEFLDEVKNDYTKYYGYIRQQKQDQIHALEILENYIKDLTRSGNLSKNNIEDAKHEQNKIIREINSIKRGLDKIMHGLDETQELLTQKNVIDI